MPIALYKENNPAIISQAYPIFKIIDEDILLPEYLMMWFTRTEFDREACFLAVGGVRGSLEWDDFLNMELPIPSLEKQKELIAEYEVIENRIQLNKKLCATLEETAQTIYKHWFEDFEFPDKNGNPYKSSGGEMMDCEEMEKEIPKGWNMDNIKSFCEVINGFAFKGEYYSFETGMKVLRGENVTEKNLRWDTHKLYDGELTSRINDYFLKPNDIVIGMDGSKVGKNWTIIPEFELPMLLAQRVACIRENRGYQNFLYQSLINLDFEYYCSQVQTGTSIPHISSKQIQDFSILIPNKSELDKFELRAKVIRQKIFDALEQTKKLKEIKSLLLGKMAVDA